MQQNNTPPAPPTPKPETEKPFPGRMEDFANISRSDVELLALCARILKRHRGNTTPFEFMIYDLLILYGVRDAQGRGITVEEVENALAEFRLNLSEAVEEARVLVNLYKPEPPADSASE